MLDDSLAGMAASLGKGLDLGEAMAKEEVFPTLMTSTLVLGQEVGRLPELLIQVSELVSESARVRLAMLISLLEPMVMVLMGLVVGFIVISTFLPVFQLLQVQL